MKDTTPSTRDLNEMTIRYGAGRAGYGPRSPLPASRIPPQPCR